jgi:uncharacterized sporulation protein YeaH/YhbH (DUF444 family)
VLARQQEFVEGDVLQRPQSAERQIDEAGEGDGEDAFRFVLTREEFSTSSSTIWSCPISPSAAGRSPSTKGPPRRLFGPGSPANIAVNRTVRLAMRRMALQRPRTRGDRTVGAELAACSDERRPEWCSKQRSRALKSKVRRIPYIDPIDIRYRRFENEPKPVAQAVMFCLMDVSGSMTEHMKDLAKRFYMLLYVFLTRAIAAMSRSSSSVTPTGRGGGRGNLLPQPRDGRHAGFQRAAGHA